ncbi:hypothetical protein DZC78_10075 [Olleya aquimaris]|uniref:Uncharacterized protein n=1 Tax=Olleya sediminilitoris TaxID=2795739 RepID=A0ABS1WH50_9FLAO|nr:hypothetical protein [Olleya sediminilitoris]AXO80715.1 hypothetical protein DZC78_10075 [Olleya aquimaris]MBL7558449.1 hypothetical protein [Olleya sediminilitoris]
MALTYRLKFTRKLDEKPELKELIEKNDNKFFLISKLYSSTRGCIESHFDKTLIIKELGSSSIISFDVIDKEVDPIAFRKSLIDAVHKITTEIYPEEDYFFEFNGDIIHEIRENGEVKLNGHSSFYNDLASLS